MPDQDTSPGLKSDVWDYVRRRNELDREIQEKFARPVTVMFTDIKGSTTFFDMRGDLEGVTMLQRHNDLVVPPIEAHGGRVLQRLGDGLLAVFPTPAPGVRAGIEIQRRLHEYNSQAPEREQIHVRVGLNSGLAMVEESNVFGDAVNTAARVQTLAEPDQILVSDSTYREACPELGADIFLPVGPAALKGKLEKVVVHEVIWSDEQARLRAAVAADARTRRALRLEIRRTGGRLTVTARETSGVDAVGPRTSVEMAYDEAAVTQTVARMEALLAGADREGRVSKQNLDDLAGLGRLLAEQLLPADVRAQLSATTAPELVLGLDDQLPAVPWELLHDGREFLGLRFGLGRVVAGARPLAASRSREAAAALKLAIVADPEGTAPEARQAATELGSHLGDRREYRPVVNDAVVTRHELLAQFGTSDVVHLAGRAQYASGGFQLADGVITVGDLSRLPANATVPRLVFFAASEPPTPGRNPHDGKTAFGLAAAVLGTGVTHFVGSLLAVAGTAGFRLAHEFYRQLAAGQSIGLALREARREAVRRDGKTALTWAAYALYGDPTARYVTAPLASQPLVKPSAARILDSRRLLMLLGGGAAVAVLAAAVVFTASGSGGQARLDAAYRELEGGRLDDAARGFQEAASVRPAEAHEGLALVALRQNDAASAQKHCAEVQKLGAQRPACMLVHGDVVAGQGDLPRAAAAYQSVIAFAGVPSVPKSIAFNRLGRVAAEQGQVDQAQAAYQKAQEEDPRNAEALGNLGALLRKQGKYAEAAPLLEKAAALSPGDPVVQALLKDVRDAAGSRQDAERQRRVDALVNELVGKFQRGEVARPAVGRDDWTSPPLTISLLGLESRGRMPFREGEYDFLMLRIGQALETQTRARLVERIVTDKLLAELKLSSSALADQRTALQLGRVLSARLITVGSVAGGPGEWTLTMRVIETETSQVVASFAQSFPASQTTAQAADIVARELAARLRRTFPLRARVTAGGGGEAVLNVGTAEGAIVGQKLLVFREGSGGQREVIGEAEITEVTDRTSRARLTGGPGPVTAGLKALERP